MRGTFWKQLIKIKELSLTKKSLFFIMFLGLFFAFIALLGYQSYLIPHVLLTSDSAQQQFYSILSSSVLFVLLILIFFSLIEFFFISLKIKKQTKILFKDDLSIKMQNEQKAYNDVLQLYKTATTDKKTGVMLFKPFLKLVEKEMVRGTRYNTPFSLAKVILNNKKNVDALLHKVTQNLKTTLREIDSISINDEQEIYILLPNIKKHNGFRAMQRVDKRIHRVEESTNTKIQMAVGVVSFPEDGQELKELWNKLDSKIEKSKLLGNNTIIY